MFVLFTLYCHLFSYIRKDILEENKEVVKAQLIDYSTLLQKEDLLSIEENNRDVESSINEEYQDYLQLHRKLNDRLLIIQVR